MTAISIVLKATALLAAAAGVDAFLRRRGSAATRHFVWTTVLTALLVLPLAEVALPHWTIRVRLGAPAALLPASTVPETSAALANADVRPGPPAAPLAPRRSGVVGWTAIAVGAYLAGVLLLVARFARESMALRRLARASREIGDSAWQRLLDDATTDLGIIRRVRLLRADDEIVPITFGTFRPAVIVPPSAGAWSEDRRRAVLRHEVAHVARRDCLAQIVGATACAMYWPHPGVWWAVHRLRVERELACDDRVLAAGAEPHAYARHLLDLARSLRPAPGAALAMARARDLETRLRAVVDIARNRAGLPRRERVLAIVVPIVTVLAMATLRAAIAPRRSARSIVPSVALQSNVSAVPSVQALSGTWEVRISSDGAAAHLTVRTGHGLHGETMPTARLEALAGVRMASADGPVHFSIHRDQGAFVGEGVCRGGMCAGTGRFEPDPAFAAGLAKRGIGAPSPAEALQLAIHDIGFEFLDEIARAGYAKPDMQALVRTAQHGVGLAYLREMTALGYRVGTLDALIRLRDHGVDPGYVRGLAANGLAKLAADDLVRARDHGVDPSYVQGMRALGFSMDLDGLIDARGHGVDPQYARDLAALGYSNLSMADLIAGRNHGVDGHYARGMQDLGYRLSFGELFQARDHGVDPAYASGLSALGYKGLSLDALIKLRNHGVNPDYVRGLAALGYANVPVDSLVRMRDHGVDPEYVRRLKQNGITNLTIDQLIDRRDRGLDDPSVGARDRLATIQSFWRSLVGK